MSNATAAAGERSPPGREPAAVVGRATVFLGLEVSRWLFAARIWVAMVLALYAAFWLQLQSASSAAVSVAILALPTRGQAFQKAAYRILATFIGFVASLIISGLFGQTPDLMLFAFAAWLGLCVYASTFLDGNRAYGAVLAGYTVAIVSIGNIDAPQNVFMSGVNRCAAIVVGVTALAFVNDFLATPDVYTGLLKSIEDALGKTRSFVRSALEQGELAEREAAELLKIITGCHPEITALVTESPAGRIRGAAARTAVAAMASEVSALQTFLVVSRDHVDASALRADLAHRVEAGLPHPSGDAVQGDLDQARTPDDLAIARYASAVLEQDRLASDGLAAMRAEHWPRRRVRLSIYRDRRAALRNSLRVFFAVLVSAEALTFTNWSATSLALMQIGAFSAISTTNPNPRGLAQGALIAIPAAAACAGIVQFLVLSGVSDFPLLAFSMAPVVIGACLLQSSPNPRRAGIGFLLLVFFPVVLAPANPQNYDPQTYLTTSVQICLSAIGLFLVLYTILPTSDRRRRRWLFASLRSDLNEAFAGRSRRGEPGATYRAADRIAQLARLPSDGEANPEQGLRQSLTLSDLARTISRAYGALRALPSKTEHGGLVQAAEAALRGRSAQQLRTAAEALLAQSRASPGAAPLRQAAAELAAASMLLAEPGIELEALGQ